MWPFGSSNFEQPTLSVQLVWLTMSSQLQAAWLTTSSQLEWPTMSGTDNYERPVGAANYKWPVGAAWLTMSGAANFTSQFVQPTSETLFFTPKYRAPKKMMKQLTLHTASTQWPLSPHTKWTSNYNPFCAKNQPEPPIMQSWPLLSQLQGTRPCGQSACFFAQWKCYGQWSQKGYPQCAGAGIQSKQWHKGSNLINFVRLCNMN